MKYDTKDQMHQQRLFLDYDNPSIKKKFWVHQEDNVLVTIFF